MTKKNFKGMNPAEAFISVPEEPVKEEAPALPTATPAKPPEGYKLNPLYVETRSKRVQLLLQPSTVQALKDLAKAQGESMNELANKAILEYLERNK